MNEKFNRLTIISEPFHKRTEKENRIFVTVQCDCGTVFDARERYVYNNRTRSCGCLVRENMSKVARKYNKRHGLSSHPLYRVWKCIKSRCYKKSHKAYENYGGRGITVCDEWKNNFQAFYDFCTSNGWRTELQTDRIDNNGNYEHSNVHFVTPETNSQNKRNVILFTFNGETKSLKAWSRDPRCTTHYQALLKAHKQNQSLFRFIRTQV